MTMLADSPNQSAPASGESSTFAKLFAKVFANQRTGLVLLIIVLVVIFGSLRSAFFNEQLVLFPMVQQIAMLTVVGLSQLAVLSIGHLNIRP
jgi:ribose/xylose/arabinose/galactoside ABC-type transport system permease subunit